MDRRPDRSSAWAGQPNGDRVDATLPPVIATLDDALDRFDNRPRHHDGKPGSVGGEVS